MPRIKESNRGLLNRPQAFNPKIALPVIALVVVFGTVAIFRTLASSTQSLFADTAKPKITNVADAQPVELGVKFKSDVAGSVTGIRFYKGSKDTGTHLGNLWSSNGALLATATFSDESASGWQQVSFSKAVAITAGTLYVASYHTASGHYSDDTHGFASQIDAAPLHAPADGASGPNGVYAYGGSSSFPTNGYQASNYWVDVLFAPEPPADTVAPTVAVTKPATNGTITGTVNITGTASDNATVARVEVGVDNAVPQAATGASSWTYGLDTTPLGNGAHTLKINAYDTAGNIGRTTLAVTVSNVATTLNVDKQAITHQSSASKTIAVSGFSTSSPNELVLAFLSSDGDKSSAQSFDTVSGGGLTWSLKRRTNTQAGTSEIWQATASAALSNVTITATRNNGSYQGSMAVYSFQGAATAAVGGANGSNGAPTSSLVTTAPGSWVWAVGNDWDRAAARTPGSGQTKTDEYLSSAGDTYWVQQQTAMSAAPGTTVTINDTAPTNDRWNLALVEILPATATVPGTADTTPPTAPANLAANLGAGSTQANLSWSPSTDNTGVTGYQVFRGTTLIAQPTLPSYVDTNLSLSTTYTYSVKAVDAAGNVSAASNSAAVTTPGDTTAPTVPSNLSASLGTTAGQVNLSWSAATDNVGVTKYLIYRSGTLVGQPTGTSFTDTAATTGATYSYTVKAQDAAGNVSAASAAASITLPQPSDTTAPSAPNNLTATAVSPTQVSLSWTASTDNVGVTSYLVYRGSTVIAQTATTSYNDTSALANTTYSYTVRAQDAAANVGVASAAATVKTPNPPDTQAPSTPAGLTATAASSTQVNLAWTASTDNIGVSTYQIFRGGSQIGTTQGTSYGDATATAGTSYSYTVKAADAAGNVSAASNTATITTPGGTTTPPVGYQLWSDPATWGGQMPGTGSVVTIAAGTRILLDTDAPKLGGLIVNGELDLADRATTLRSAYINVFGKFIAGTTTTPLRSQITIVLDGQPTDNQVFGAFNAGADVFANASGGTLELHGQDVGTPWTRLAKTVAAGSTTITLQEPVAWPNGSSISLASASTDPAAEDRATISGISADGKTLTLSAPLKFRHVSEVTSQTVGSETRSVPEQDEVGLLSHNIKITGPDNAPQTLFGGHVVTMKGGITNVSNIELYHMGQLGILARYPLHWHFVGDGSGSTVNNVSIHDSYNRFLSIHETNNLRINGLVGDQTFGHGIITEDGVEQNNVLTNNLLMGVRRPPDATNVASIKAQFPNVPICPSTSPTTKFAGNTSAPAGSNCRVRASDDNSSEFWITNPNNTFSGNVAAGGDGAGFWYDFSFNSDNTCLTAPETLSGTAAASCNGQAVLSSHVGDFTNNSAHSHTYPCGTNSAEAKAVCGQTSGEQFASNCFGSGICIEDLGGEQSHRASFANPIAWMNRGEGMWYDGYITITNPMAANNGVALTNQSSYTTGGLLIGSGTAVGGTDHSFQNGLLRFYHGQGDDDNIWLAGYGTYADSPDEPSIVSALTDANASSWDATNRVKGLKFFDNWPNVSGSQQLHSYRVGYTNNGCYFKDYPGLNFGGHDHWVADLDGSVLGNGVPATITNNTPFLRPVGGTDNVGDSKGNTTCNSSLGTDGGVFVRSGGQTILNPNAGIGYFIGDAGFISPGVRGFMKMMFPSPQIKTITRDADGMSGSFDTSESVGDLAMNQRYRLANSGDTAFSSFSTQVLGNDTGWYDLYFKWSPSTAKVSLNSYSGTRSVTAKATSLAQLDAMTTNGYYLDTTNHLLYIHASVQGNAPAFGNPGNLSGMTMDGLPYPGNLTWTASQ